MEGVEVGYRASMNAMRSGPGWKGLGRIQGKYECYEEGWSRMEEDQVGYRASMNAMRRGGPGWKGLGWIQGKYKGNEEG